MPIASMVETYRERAKECFRLAATARDAWTKRALEDLGHEMLQSAEELQPREPGRHDGAAPRTEDTHSGG